MQEMAKLATRLSIMRNYVTMGGRTRTSIKVFLFEMIGILSDLFPIDL